ncbi:hypothetical protein IPH92_02170 [Candidatus Kaiserbacteria bacterium]|nr:MAG: hypothetical protein IPH92_02170 [Candidatus Kaiserbacteria bacterium]
MFGFGGEKPKAVGGEMGQGEAREEEKSWAEMVAEKKAQGQMGERKLEPLMRPDESVIEPEGISPESINRGYEGSVASGVGSLGELVPQIDIEAEKKEQLDAMSARIEESYKHPGDDERMAA